MCQPKCVLDFEKGLLNAFSKRWPDAEERLCHFHLAKSLFTNVQKKGMLPLYELPEVQKLLRCFSALPFLPTNEVVVGYNEICDAIKSLIPAVIAEDYRSKLNGKTPVSHAI